MHTARGSLRLMSRGTRSAKQIGDEDWRGDADWRGRKEGRREGRKEGSKEARKQGREGKGREGKGREGKGREGKGREGKGREGRKEGRTTAIKSNNPHLAGGEKHLNT